MPSEAFYRVIGDLQRQINELKREMEELRAQEQPPILWLSSRSADPTAPTTGGAVLWQSTSAGAGDDGDIIIKINNEAGTTKTHTLVDHSAV